MKRPRLLCMARLWEGDRQINMIAIIVDGDRTRAIGEVTATMYRGRLEEDRGPFWCEDLYNPRPWPPRFCMCEDIRLCVSWLYLLRLEGPRIAGLKHLGRS